MMTNERRLVIAKNVLQALEDQLEQLTLEAKIAARTQDIKGGEQIRARLIDAEKRVKVAEELLKEIENAAKPSD